MRYLSAKLGILWPFLATAAPAPPLSQLPPVIPLHQEMGVVDYFRDGRQTGCGLRITGEHEENARLNVLLSVFINEAGRTFGIFKVSAKESSVGNNSPLLRHDQIAFSSIGKIHRAWLKAQPMGEINFYKNEELLHIDGFMVSMEFASALDMLVAISHASFKVGIEKNEGGPEDIFEFSKQINSDEASKLLACMNNLRVTIKEKGEEGF